MLRETAAHLVGRHLQQGDVGQACMVGNVGANTARVHTQHGDGRVAQFLAQRITETAYRRLGRVVHALRRHRHHRENAGDVDQGGLGPRTHLWQKCAATMHHTPEVDVHDPLGVRRLQFFHRRHQGDAGVVHQDVSRAKPGQAGLRQGKDVSLLARVHVLNMAVRTRGLQLCCHPGKAVFIDVCQQQAGAPRAAFDGQRPANAGSCTGDDNDLVLEGLHRSDFACRSSRRPDAL